MALDNAEDPAQHGVPIEAIPSEKADGAPLGLRQPTSDASSSITNVVDRPDADMDPKMTWTDDSSSQGENRPDPTQPPQTTVVGALERDASDPYKNLPAHEAAILKRQVETTDVKVGLWSLYRYSSKTDIFLLVIGTVASIVAGALLPCMPIIFGTLQGTLGDFSNGFQNRDAFESEMSRLVLWFVYLAIAMFTSLYISMKLRSPTAHASLGATLR